MGNNVNAIKGEKPGTTISNNTFTGVHWDAAAIEAVTIVAQGLLNLTEVFKSQNIKIGSLLYIESDNKDDDNED
jgi:hypothetical protein